ncbi:MAG: hypothetical protein ACOYNC_14485 [Bacteroidales bacterium]
MPGKPRYLTLLLLFTAGMSMIVNGQHFQSCIQAENRLSEILSLINKATNDGTKDSLNQVFSTELSEILILEGSDNYPFDSLKTLVKLKSPDHKFRIFHWNLPSADGKHRYFGFIKMTGLAPPLIYQLVDFSDSLVSPDTLLLDNMHWPGALYYKVIPGETSSGGTIYTLLGWAGRNQTITQKVIEILSFDGDNKPHFGYKLFPDYKNGSMTRIVFRFGATTTMSLKFEKQTIVSNKKWNIKKRDFDYSLQTSDMIVFDKMVPLDPLLEGQFQYYVAAGDTFDGFLFSNHFWTFIAGIDTRNKK